MTHHTLIIGGGITGLAAAHALQQEAHNAGHAVSFTLLESDTRVGGKIQTEYADGFTIDGGPDCFLSRKPWALELFRSLGLGDELMGTNDDMRQTFVLNRGKLTPLPDGVMLIIPTKMMPFATSRLISVPGKIRMGMDLFIPPRRDTSDETVASFVRRRLGQEALDKIAEPLMSGIHISDPERQSLLGSFPLFHQMEQKHGSLIKAMLKRKTSRTPATNSNTNNNNNGTASLAMFMTLQKGLGQGIQALAETLRNGDRGEIVTGKRVVRLEQVSQTNGAVPRYRAHTADGSIVEGDSVVLATPAYVSAELLAPLNPPLSDALRAIRYVTTATMSLGFRLADVGKPFDGFGFVIPRKEHRRITGCTWTSTKFHHRTPPDRLLLRSFIGGPGHEDLAEQPDEDLATMVRDELRDIMGLRAEPVLQRIFRWTKANPQYDVGHLDRVREMHAMSEQTPGVFLAGSAFEGVGVPDCVRQGQEAARKTISYLNQVGRTQVSHASTTAQTDTERAATPTR
jgi:protoporphyrinogen/coproporphyrinogen III oxidase